MLWMIAVSILIRITGEMTLAQMRQALFEAICELEDELAIGHTQSASLFINPTNGLGEKVVARNSLGGVVSRVTKKGPYRPSAEEYNI
jgi:hypothetical protein